MNLFSTSLQRAAAKVSLKKLQKARSMAIQGIGTTDAGRVEAVKPETEREAGTGSVKDWADAMHIRVPRKITSFIQRKLRD